MTRRGGAKIEKSDGVSRMEVAVQDDMQIMPSVDGLKILHDFRPDLVDKAVQLASEEAQSRRDFDNKRLEVIQQDNISGRRSALILAVISIIAASFLGYTGHEISAVAVCGFPVAMMIVSFLRR